jgi:uncharacterized protein (TIGR03067 family)
MGSDTERSVPDLEAIQGLWRVVSYISRGSPIHSGTTHYLFEKNRVKAINPSLVDGGDWASFELDPDTHPKRLSMTYEWTNREGNPVTRIHREAYELDGDTLRLCWPNVFGHYPEVISDRIHGVSTLTRDSGPLPTTKLRSGKQPIDDPVIGRLIWDDNFDSWDTRIQLGSGDQIDCHIEPGNRSDETVVEAGREAIDWLRLNEANARRYAAQELLDTHNDSWNDGDAISSETFAGRMSLESIAVDSSGGIELYYNDGELFCGHCIIVSVTESREFKHASFAG